jgi:hypothetical protein
LCWYGLFYACGAIALARADHDNYRPLGIETNVAIAAAMPGSRARALALIANIRVPNDDAGLELGLAIDAYEGGCGSQRLFHATHYEQAIAAARSCGDTDGELDALLALGRYDEAANVTGDRPTSREAVTALLGAGRWSDARGAIRSAHRRKPAFRCFEELLDDFADSTRPLPDVPDAGDDCGLLELLRRGERIDPYSHISALHRQLVPIVDLEPYDFARYHQWSHHEIWLAPFVEMPLHQELAVVAMLRGRLDDARNEITSATRPAPELAAAIALMEGARLQSAPDTSIRFDDVAARARTGVIEPLDQYDRDDMPAFAAAVAGDGLPLAQLMRTDGVWWSLRGAEVFGLAPRVREHRQELATALRSFHARRDFKKIDPFEEIDNDADYRDLARLVGDVASASRWQTIIDRHAAMLGDRKRAIAMVIWQTLSS